MKYCLRFLPILLLAILTSCNKAAESPYPAISFVRKATIPGNGRSSAVAFTINDKGYVALGRDSLQNRLKDCWQYNPTLDNWTKQADFPGIARVNAMAEVVNGKAYVGLGYSSGIYTEAAYLKDFYMFDPEPNTWTQKANFPGTDTNACVSFVLNGNIFVCSGFQDNGFNNLVWKYDPTLNTWTQLKDAPFPARAGAVLCQNGNEVFVGTGYRTSMENDWWKYIPENDSWIKQKSMPDKGRVNSVGISVGDRCFVATGRYFGGNLTGGHLKSDILEYDKNKNLWYLRGSLPASERENAISLTIGGKAFIGFGENETNVLNDFWSFEP